MSASKPVHQRIAIGLVWALLGMIALGDLLNAVNNAYSLVTPFVTYLGTIVLTSFWLLVKVSRFEWWVPSGQVTRLRGLGPKFSFGIFGCLALLWIPRFSSVQPPRKEASAKHSEAQKAFSEGLTYLKYYDLLKAERHFCRALRIEPEFLRARLYLARTWRDRGYDDAAAKEAQRLLDMANDLKAEHSEVKLYEAFCAETRGRWGEAIDNYRSLWDEKGILSFDALALVQALNLAGQNRLALETIDEIRTRYMEEKVELPPLDGVRLEIEKAIALMKGRSAEQLAAARDAERTARGAEGKARRIDDSLILARAQFVQCDALNRLEGKYEPLCRSALAGFQKQGDSADVAKVYQVLGHNAAKPEEGLAYYRQALAIYKSLGFQRGISDVRVDISQLLFDAGHKYEAAQVCGAALEAAGRIASLNVPEIRLDCTYYAKILDHDFAGAEKEAEEVLTLTRQQGNRRLEAVALQDLAYVVHARGLHPKAALQSYREAMAIEKELQDDSWEARETILNYAWLLSDLGHHPEARRELERALKPYPMSDRLQRVAEIVCWDRPILGNGTAEWRKMLEKSAGLTPKQCGEKAERKGAPLVNLDPALWARVEVEEPHC